MPGDRQGQDRVAEHRHRPGGERARWFHAQRDQATEDGSGADGGLHPAVRGRGDQHRAERHQRAEQEDPEHDPHQDHAPQPRAGAELVPARGEVLPRRRPGAGHLLDAQPGQAQRADREGGRVHGVDRPRAEEPEQHTGRGRSEQFRPGVRDPDDGVRPVRVGGHLRHDAVHPGLEHRRRRAAHRRARDEQPQRRDAREERDRDDALAGEANQVGAEHQGPRPDPVGQHAAEQDQAEERDHPRGEDHADPGRAVDLADRQGRGHGQHRVAEDRDRPGDEVAGEGSGPQHRPILTRFRRVRTAIGQPPSSLRE